MKHLISLLLMIQATIPLVAQEENALVREGNKLYEAKKFTDAEIAYRKGLQKNPKSFEAAYNLGNALFRQEKYAEAMEQYQKITPQSKEAKDRLAAAFHNAGNSLLLQQKVAESIDAYKQSLKLNPNDNETRYNLAYAQHLLKNQQEPPPPQPQQQPKEEEKKEQKPQQQQQPEISPERAQQILEALMQDEKETMEKAKQQPKSSRKGTDKNW